MFALLLHIYYKESWDTYLNEVLSKIKYLDFDLYINLPVSQTHNYELVKKIKVEYPSAIIIESPNIGKDIGGKLALLNHFFVLKSNKELIVFLHDKKSPQSATGERWRKTLYKIVDNKYIPEILNLLKNKKTGIVGAKECIINEKDSRTKLFKSNNSSYLDLLLAKYSIVPNDFYFIGGTMFWIKREAIEPFFLKYSAIECRSELEKGNVSDDLMGSKTHAWERLICWINSSRGYSLKGI